MKMITNQLRLIGNIETKQRYKLWRAGFNTEKYQVICLFQIAYRTAGSLTDVVVETHRRKHLAYLMADQGALVNPDSSRNLPKQVIIIFTWRREYRRYWDNERVLHTFVHL